MTKTLFKYSALAVSLLAASVVFAAEGHEAVARGPDKTFIYAVINFFVLFFLLFFALKKPAREFFAGRALTIKIAIDEAKKTYELARQGLQTLEAKIKNSDAESRELIASVKKQAEVEKDGIVAQAAELAQKIKNDVQEIARQEVVKAKQSLKVEAIEIAANLAADKLKQTLTADDQAQLGQLFATQVQKAGAR